MGERNSNTEAGKQSSNHQFIKLSSIIGSLSENQKGVYEVLKERHPTVSPEKTFHAINDVFSVSNNETEDKEVTTEFCSVCIDKGIVIEELTLLKVMLENNLESATRSGIQVINYGEAIAIVNDEEKLLKQSEINLFKILIRNEDDDDEYFQDRIGQSKATTNSIYGSAAGGVSGGGIDESGGVMNFGKTIVVRDEDGSLKQSMMDMYQKSNDKSRKSQ